MSKEKGLEKPREKRLSYAEDDFYILYFQLFFQTTHDCCLHSKIRLVLSPTLYKFIVWACWAKTQSCFGVQAKTGPYNIYVCACVCVCVCVA